MKAVDFGDKLSDLADTLENAHDDIEAALNQWDGEEMDEEQKTTILFYQAGIAALQGQLERDQAANTEAIQEEEAVDADGEEEA